MKIFTFGHAIADAVPPMSTGGLTTPWNANDGYLPVNGTKPHAKRRRKHHAKNAQKNTMVGFQQTLDSDLMNFTNMPVSWRSEIGAHLMGGHRERREERLKGV